MGDSTKIQWTDKTFNGWWGCTKVGPGCDHCYADAFDRRTGGAHWGTGVSRKRTSPHNWNEPRRWNRQAMSDGYRPWVFASSMCDVFDNEVPDEWRNELFALIRETPYLRWQLLTKRVGNVIKMVPAGWPNGFEHVGVMATIVNQDEMDRDGPKLMAVEATWRGISYEPALGPLRDLPAVDWLIVGGESGPQARPFHVTFARDAIAECRSKGIACFVKQLGRVQIFGSIPSRGLNDPKGGDWDEWPADLRVRQFPPAPPVGSFRLAA